jgi:hypothetical protein
MDKATGSNPLQAENTSTLEHAASRLLQEPEQSAPLEEESEDVAEPSEDEELADEIVDEEDDSEQESDEDEGEDEDEEEPSEDEEELSYYTIKVDGEELEVTLEELQSGYQRQKDYTKKTQAIAEQRKDYESKAAQLEQLQTQYLQQAQLANELLNRDLKKFEKVDWEALKTEDPVGYVQKQIEVNEVRQRQQQLQQQAQQAYEHNQQRQAEENAKYMEMQRKEALQLFPHWKDPEKADIHKREMIEYGRAVGYADDVLGNISNALDLVTLDKAMKYDRLMATKKGIGKKATPPAIRKKVKAKGLAPKGLAKQKVHAEKSEALRKSGSLKDAAALMMELRSGKEVRK